LIIGNLNLWIKKQKSFQIDQDFSLQDLFDEEFKLDPHFYFYKGSLTTPPCTNNVLWLVFGKPLPIPDDQLQVLRENSLNSLKEREIHSRITQKSFNREVVKKTCKAIKFNKNLNNYLDANITGDLKIANDRNVDIANSSNIFGPVPKESMKNSVIKMTKTSLSSNEIKNKIQLNQEKIDLTNSKSEDCVLS